MVLPLIWEGSLFSMLSWSSQEDDPVGPTPEEQEEQPKKRAFPPESEELQPVSESDIQKGRRFVCATCGYEIGSNCNLFFMLDSVYCSQQCRTASVSKSDDTYKRLRDCWNMAPRKASTAQHPTEHVLDIFATVKKRERSKMGEGMFDMLTVVT